MITKEMFEELSGIKLTNEEDKYLRWVEIDLDDPIVKDYEKAITAIKYIHKDEYAWGMLIEAGRSIDALSNESDRAEDKLRETIARLRQYLKAIKNIADYGEE